MPIEDYHKTKLLLMFIKSNKEIKNIEHAKKLFQELKNKNDEIEKQETLINLNVITNEEQNKVEENPIPNPQNYKINN